jgi:hypothetical protein
MRSIKKSLIIGGVMLFVVALSTNAFADYYSYINMPSSTQYYIGDTFTAQIKVGGESDPLVSIGGGIYFSNRILQATSITWNSAATNANFKSDSLTSVADANTNGYISFRGIGIIDNFVFGIDPQEFGGTVLTITFLCVSDGSGVIGSGGEWYCDVGADYGMPGNSSGYYSDQTIHILKAAPTVTTTEASSITATTATSGGNATSDGGATVTSRGVCFGTAANPAVGGTDATCTINGAGTGNFTSILAGLAPSTTYYIRAYAANSAGTGYGSNFPFTTAALPKPPSVTTTAASAITATTATSGGNATSDGGATVTTKGVCFCSGTTAEPAVGGVGVTCTVNGAGVSTFTSSLAGLIANTTYRIRAYATNSAGTGYGSVLSFTTKSFPIVSTTAASAITADTAVSGGDVTSDEGSTVTAKGVCFGTAENPAVGGTDVICTINGAEAGTFTSSLAGLIANTTYQIRAYATNSAGTGYGSVLSFTTKSFPIVSTTVASAINATTAASGGDVSSDGGLPVTARGVCISKSENPAVGGADVTCTINGSGTGGFISNLTGLSAGMTYHIRAYAINDAGERYGDNLTFTTIAPPKISTTAASNITGSTAVCGGLVDSDGGAAVTARGVCVGITKEPAIGGVGVSCTNDGKGTGIFFSSLISLISNTSYHIRAYATNRAGTEYGSDLIFTTKASVPIVNTSAASAITADSAASGGWIDSDGGSMVTERGVCISPGNNTAATCRSDVTGADMFFINLSGLTANTTYQIYAYASNSEGTGYGQNLVFTTKASVPIVSTISAFAITADSAASGGTVDYNGGAAITARGVCISTTANPTVTWASCTYSGTGNGMFTSNLSGLAADTTYHIRAYASNSEGTGYGSDSDFKTACDLSITSPPAPMFGIIGKKINFIASGSGTWNFGDGENTVTGETASHIYKKEGSYTVTLKTDIGCEITAKVTISSDETIPDIKAIIVAGGGPYPQNTLWSATKNSANYAYKVLRHEGYSNDNIYYLSPDTSIDVDGDGQPDVDDEATSAKLEYAITEWAKDAKSLILFMVDHGGDGQFQINGTKNPVDMINADDLGIWLDKLQMTMPGKVIVVYDACRSGSFLPMEPPDGKERIVITSSLKDEKAWHLNDGILSFSYQFWAAVFGKGYLYDAFLAASDIMAENQSACLDANGNGICSDQDKDDQRRADGILIGRGLIAASTPPIINKIVGDQTLNGETSAKIWASDISGLNKISRVWAVIVPPDYDILPPNQPVTINQMIDLSKNKSSDLYEGYYDRFTRHGTYKINIYATDTDGNYSIPKQTTVLQSKGNSCLPVADDFAFNICAEYHGAKYGFTLNLDDADQFLWKGDLGTFRKLQSDPDNCISVSDDLKLDMCVEYQGHNYEFTMNYDNGLIWKMDVGTFREK